MLIEQRPYLDETGSFVSSCHFTVAFFPAGKVVAAVGWVIYILGLVLSSLTTEGEKKLTKGTAKAAEMEARMIRALENIFE